MQFGISEERLNKIMKGDDLSNVDDTKSKL